MTSADEPFIKMKQSMQPIFFAQISFQSGLTCSYHKTGDGQFGLVVIQTPAEQGRVCQSTNFTDIRLFSAVPVCCIISAGESLYEKATSAH